jgi:hypothetical protein
MTHLHSTLSFIVNIFETLLNGRLWNFDSLNVTNSLCEGFVNSDHGLCASLILNMNHYAACF